MRTTDPLYISKQRFLYCFNQHQINTNTENTHILWVFSVFYPLKLVLI